jgi:CHASE2 domain-containing sensor protein
LKIDCIVGLIIFALLTALLFVFDRSPPVRWASGWWYDELNSYIVATYDGEKRKASPIVVVQFDQRTLGSTTSSATKREDLARVVEIAHAAGARALLIDIDLSEDAPGDSVLLAALQRAAPLPVVVDRPLTVAEETTCGQSKLTPRQLDTIFDRSELSLPNLVHAVFEFPTGARGRVREICLAYETLSKDRLHRVVLPSAPLAAYALVTPIERRTKLLADHGDSIDRLVKGVRSRPVSTTSDAIDAALTVQHRILFEVPYNSATAVVGRPGKIVFQSASLLFAEGRGALLKDAVVVVGVTHDASRDMIPTAIGSMPGVIVAANAVYSLGQYEDLNRLQPYASKLVKICCGLVALALTLGFFWLPYRLSEWWLVGGAANRKSRWSETGLRLILAICSIVGLAILTAAIVFLIDKAVRPVAGSELIGGRFLDIGIAVWMLVLEGFLSIYVIAHHTVEEMVGRHISGSRSGH